MVPVHSWEGDASSLIFSPPNTIDVTKLERQHPITQPDPHTYVAPTKAAGDVSLSGPQLVAFLTKATFRLNYGTTRQGIQLRIGQFNELIAHSKLSDSCLKKLNFVVDAIDRNVYDEAALFFDKLQNAHPEETASNWAHGIKLLIAELKKLSTTSISNVAGWSPTISRPSPNSTNSEMSKDDRFQHFNHTANSINQ